MIAKQTAAIKADPITSAAVLLPSAPPSDTIAMAKQEKEAAKGRIINQINGSERNDIEGGWISRKVLVVAAIFRPISLIDSLTIES